MLSHNPADRPTIKEIQNHAWFKMPFEAKKAKKAIIETLRENKYDKTTNESESEK